MNLTEGQASLVARLARSRKKRQQKLRKNAKTANQREQVDEYYEMMRERVLDGPSSQARQPGTGTQGKKVPFPHPKKRLEFPVPGPDMQGGRQAPPLTVQWVASQTGWTRT